jgi:HPt (histidine-containing phosphotransfer) domain-containing protein
MIAIVNASVQEELVEMMGEEEFQDLLKEAAHKFSERTDSLFKFIDSADWLQARSMAHKIKGSMGTLGYDSLFHTLDELELRLLNVPPEVPTSSEIDQIKNVVAQTKMALPPI